MNTERQHKKLMQQVILLVALATLIGGYFIFSAIKKAPAPVPQVQPIETDFNQKSLEVLEIRDKAYPAVKPGKDDLGKDDPFR